MGAPSRVLIVDDSSVIRHVIAAALAGDPSIEVVGTAANGRLALAAIEKLNPDVVTLDIEMPVMDGLETLKALRQRWPRLPVIMFSTLTERGAAATVEALSLGASDYVTKPSHTSGPAEAAQRVRAALLPKVRALCVRQRLTASATATRARLVTPEPTAPPAPGLAPRPTFGSRVVREPVPVLAPPPPAGRVEVIAIGVSTGGPAALSRLISALPQSVPVPIVITQHMPPMFTRLLAERLDRTSALTVVEAAAPAELAPGHVYLAPGNHHLTVEKRTAGVWTGIDDGPPENSCRPSVDVMLRAVGRVYGGRALVVILTGMGQDGLTGCQELRRLGARILVQDEASSVVWGMPGAVAGAGLAERIVPLEAMAGELMRHVGASRPAVERSGA